MKFLIEQAQRSGILIAQDHEISYPQDILILCTIDIPESMETRCLKKEFQANAGNRYMKQDLNKIRDERFLWFQGINSELRDATRDLPYYAEKQVF